MRLPGFSGELRWVMLGVAYLGAILTLISWSACRNANELVQGGGATGTPRADLCQSLPAGAAWWLVPGILPIAIALLAAALGRRRPVAGLVITALAAGAAVLYVVALSTQSASSS